MSGKFRFFDAPRIGARRMQHGAAAAINGARIVASERKNIGGVMIEFRVHVGQAFPTTPYAHHFAAHLAAAVHHRLDHRIQSRDIAPASENPYFFSSRHRSISPWSPKLRPAPSPRERYFTSLAPRMANFRKIGWRGRVPVIRLQITRQLAAGRMAL